MIGDVLVFLRDHLNAKLNLVSDLRSGDAREEKVVLVDGEKMDPIAFKLGAVSVLLINVEEENTLRQADQYAAPSADGSLSKVQPEIHLNLFVLFVARFKQYDQGLNYLSLIIQHFQSHRVFNRHNAPALSEGIEKLVLELVTLPFAEQNEIWNALRTTYHPSVMYKVKMIVFRDQDTVSMPEVEETILRTSQ